MNQFERLEQYAKLQKPPRDQVQGSGSGRVNSTINFNLLPMKARADFMRVTNSSIMTNITLQFDRRDLQFQDKDGVSRGDGQHLCPHHLDGAPRGERVRGRCQHRSADRSSWARR